MVCGEITDCVKKCDCYSSKKLTVFHGLKHGQCGGIHLLLAQELHRMFCGEKHGLCEGIRLLLLEEAHRVLHGVRLQRRLCGFQLQGTSACL